MPEDFDGDDDDADEDGEIPFISYNDSNSAASLVPYQRPKKVGGRLIIPCIYTFTIDKAQLIWMFLGLGPDSLKETTGAFGWV